MEVPIEDPYPWATGDRPKKLVNRLTAAADKLREKYPVVDKAGVHKTILCLMQALKDLKAPGADKREIVVNLVVRGAEAGLRELFPTLESFQIFVIAAVNDSFEALGARVFGRGGCCR